MLSTWRKRSEGNQLQSHAKNRVCATGRSLKLASHASRNNIPFVLGAKSFVGTHVFGQTFE
eukprot:6417891-Amphidinium_carterae.1